MDQMYRKEVVSLVLDSADHPALNRNSFEKLVESEFVKFMAALPKDVEYLAPQDLTPIGVTTRFHSINGSPSVRQVTTYLVLSDGFVTRFDAEYMVPVAMVPVTAGFEQEIVGPPSPLNGATAPEVQAPAVNAEPEQHYPEAKFQ